MPYLTMAAGKGAFTTVSVGGKDIPAIAQEKVADCGPSCVGMVLRMKKHDPGAVATPAELRAASQSMGGSGGYRPAVADGAGSAAADPRLAGMAFFAAAIMGQIGGNAGPGDGTFGNNLAAMLKTRFGYAKTTSSQYPKIKDKLESASIANPIIVHVAWKKGGGHWIVACGYDKHYFSKSEFLFSDPFYGAGWLTVPSEDVGGSKQPHYSPDGIAQGNLSGWCVDNILA